MKNSWFLSARSGVASLWLEFRWRRPSNACAIVFHVRTARTAPPCGFVIDAVTGMQWNWRRWGCGLMAHVVLGVASMNHSQPSALTTTAAWPPALLRLAWIFQRRVETICSSSPRSESAATLHFSAAFLPRDAMHKRGLCRHVWWTTATINYGWEQKRLFMDQRIGVRVNMSCHWTLQHSLHRRCNTIL